MADGYRLGVDFGTSNTVAVVSSPGGRIRPLLFDGSPLLPSAVCLDPAGGLIVGRDALHAARAYPDRFEPNPKQRIDDGAVLLGDTELPVDALVASVFERVAAEAKRTLGHSATDVCLTHPAAWGPRRREVLVSAAARAGLDGPRLVPEPLAAASYFVDVVGASLPIGASLVVYDFGAGTFDASVVRRTAQGFEVLAAEGLPDAGGLDVDASLLAYLGAVYGQRHPDEWRRLEQPTSPADRRARRLLWDDVRTAKEVLSRSSTTYVNIPLIEEDAPLGREQLERLAQPIVDRTVAATRAAIRGAEVQQGAIAGVFLVGGSSRLPLVATLLHRALGIAPTAIEQPEMVVAEGSVRTEPDSSTNVSSVDRAWPSAIGRARAPAPASAWRTPAPHAGPAALDAGPAPAAEAAPARTPEAAAGPAPGPAPEAASVGRRLAWACAGLAGIAIVKWLASDPAAIAFLRFGWADILLSVAAIFAPAYLAWYGGALGGTSSSARVIGVRSAVHVLAVAVGYVVWAAPLPAELPDTDLTRSVPVLAAIATGVGLIALAARARDLDRPRPAGRWVALSFALGAAIGAGVIAHGPSTAYTSMRGLAGEVLDDPRRAVYYIPYALGVAGAVAIPAAVGAFLAWLSRRWSPRGHRILRTLAGVLLATGGIVLYLLHSYGY